MKKIFVICAMSMLVSCTSVGGSVNAGGGSNGVGMGIGIGTGFRF